jgi:catechol 2,3-dioxygenase-like lactoylglutathione lyase family enzyme
MVEGADRHRAGYFARGSDLGLAKTGQSGTNGQRLAGRRRDAAMETSGLNHIVMTVADPVRSRAFYGDLLGFPLTEMPQVPGGGFFIEVGGIWIFFFGSRRPHPDDRFSEFRIGLDHLSFTAPSRAALDALAARLTAAGVPTNGVERFAPTGNWYVAFRDPDNIQLEYWLP